MGRLTGRVGIVTGGASGIGAATARRLAAEGSVVVVADIDAERGATVAAELGESGATADAVTTDVSDEAQVRDLVAVVVDRYGGLDVMFNNAAILAIEHLRGDVGAAEISMDVWDRTFEVNVRGVVLGCKYAVPAMRARGGGSIVNTSSTATFLGEDGLFAYGTSKGAVATLTRYVATRYGRDGVRCNAVLPGPILTDTLEAVLTDDVRDVLADRVASPRLGRPDDVAAAVAFLASDDAAYVNGAHLVVDGGWSVPAPHWSHLREAAVA